MKYKFKFFIFIAFYLILVINLDINVKASEHKKVLILNSYDQGFKWTKDIENGIESVLGSSENINLYYEFMDTKNVNNPQYIEILYRNYSEKYKNIKFDAIICSDNDALKFMVNYDDELFNDAPVVFCGVNDFNSSMLQGETNFTGVVEQIDVKGTIESIFKLQPDRKDIIIVGDNSTTGKINEEIAKKVIEEFKDKAKFYYYKDISAKQLKEKVKDIEKSAAILTIGHLRGEDGSLIRLENTRIVLSDIKVPIYVTWDFILGNGIMGGKLVDGYTQGRIAAELVNKVLNGESVQNIPVIADCPTKYVFNYNELLKYDINLNDIPQNYNIINKPFSFYKTYKKLVFATISIILMLIIFILVLAFNVKRRIVSERRVKESYEELSAVYEELAATEEELRAQYDELQENEELLRVSEERYKLAVDGARDAIWEWDIANGKFFVSDKWKDITGYEVMDSDDIKTVIRNIMDKEDVERLLAELDSYIYGDLSNLRIEHKIKNNNGREKWILAKGKVLRDGDNKAIKMAGSVTDITTRKKAEEKIRFLAYYDKLTKLPNGTLFLDKLRAEIEKIKNSNKMGAVFFIDLDNFKNINDTLGHDFGDELLKVIAREISGVLINNEILSRLGGDEFLVLQSGIEDIEDIENLAEEILNLFQNPFNVRQRKIFATISIGITVFPKDGVEENFLLKNADTAMYRAKEAGKNRYLFYDSNMFDEIMRKNNLEKGLREAILKDELKLVFQPQIDVISGKTKGAEVLLRWKSNEFGNISPGEFIPLAEATSLINPIGRWVLKEACLKNVEWLDGGFSPITICVNVSVVQIQQEGFLDSVKDILEETKLPPEYLELEITESILMKYVKQNLLILDELKALGIKIALDDFGTGYSSLSYLRILPINKLKLDKSFIDEIHLSESNKSIVEGLIELAHKIGITVIAEGVEIKDQYSVLRDINCDEIQGYYFSRPISADEFERFIK
ncbi:ABC transporter substrate binding protein [Clostridium sp. JNZ J1-5]